MDTKLIAIFGYNSMSFELVKQLSSKQNSLLILDADPKKIALAQQNNLPAQLMDYRQDTDLISIGLDSQIETLFCFLENDSENVFLTLSARALNSQLKIISIINQPESAEKLLAAGANKIIDPYEACSSKIYQLLTKPSIAWVLDQVVFGRADLHMSEITIPQDSSLDKTLTSQLQLNQKYNLFLIGVVDKELGEKLYFALGEQDHTLDVGDILVILGANRDIRKFKKEIGVIE
ncbi:MAG: TrkA family potassium uptake protein [Methyloprofundus sp.]|nr:TrkA family potassium uptake protein [Methyloprofundus sp.]